MMDFLSAQSGEDLHIGVHKILDEKLFSSSTGFHSCPNAYN
jgi:hypothetical protein